MSVVKGAVIKGDACFMVILNANYTPTKRKLQIYFAVRLHQTRAWASGVLQHDKN